MDKCSNCQELKPFGVIFVDNPSNKKPKCIKCGRTVVNKIVKKFVPK